ncbi:MAG: MBL fold metallo-hydrolase [Erysipelotrichaceae bacterium]|nr:MBL fold metallo-hydrolase [Erysipelotrichaceae bacterium]
MKLYFIGADHEVTGSCHVVEVNGKYIMLDCGLEQGRDIYVNEDLPVSPDRIDAVLLSHAHIDHSGLLPWLVKEGFKGEIWCTEVTRQLCDVMLKDSAHIQETEVEWSNRKAKRSGRKQKQPLYTVKDAEKAMRYFRSIGYGETFEPVEGVSARFEDGGHILGSAIIYLNLKEKGQTRTLAFTGDLGNTGMPIVSDPSPRSATDYVITESTYGDRLHETIDDPLTQLTAIMKRTFDRGGNVVIPAFAVGRTQEILYFIREMLEKKMLDGYDFDVYVDSPMAEEATAIFEENVFGYYDEDALRIIREGGHPLVFPNLKTSVSLEESKQINFSTRPSVIISASGMCSGGRVRHHLKHNLWRPECTIALAGYQAEGTLGRRLLEGDKDIRLFQEDIHVKAEIVQLQDVSAHADQKGLISWLNDNYSKPQMVFVVHGEDQVCSSYAELLKTEHGYEASAPYSGYVYDLLKGDYVYTEMPDPVLTVAQKKEKICRDQNREQDVHSQNRYFNELMDQGKKLLRLIEKRKDARNSELKRFLKEVKRVVERWD